MKCDFCERNSIHSTGKCKIRKLNCERFKFADGFWCKRWQLWARIPDFCHYKVLNKLGGDFCVETCKMYQEMMELAKEHLHPFPELPRLITHGVWGQWERNAQRNKEEMKQWVKEKEQQNKRLTRR